MDIDYKDYAEEVKKLKDELFEYLSHNYSEEDMPLFYRAYDLAEKAHAGQTRRTGEPYIIHPISVALIVAKEMELDADTVVAALAHDIVEDTPYTLEDIRTLFGHDVAFLVGVVTKPKKGMYQYSKQVDNFRQILKSLQYYDTRAIKLKLADRMHNMRTLNSMPRDKQMKIAAETDYFFAPLANRLGMYRIKNELENCSFCFRCPHEYNRLMTLIDKAVTAEQAQLDTFVAKIDALLKANGIKATIEPQYRMPYSMWRKMQALGCNFMHVPHKHYTRVVFDADESMEKKMCLRIYAALTDTLKEQPGSVVNYINTPKENGYQSFHVKLLNDCGTWEELHISSRRMVRNTRLGGYADDSVREWIENMLTALNDAGNGNGDTMAGVTASFYNDDIMVYTPKGKGIKLPKNATALDLAFAVHDEVGLHAVYARINGRLCSVKTTLHRGDCVEIGTAPDAVPDDQWLQHVLTYKARHALGSLLAHRLKQPYRLCPCCHPLPGDEVTGFREPDGEITLHKSNCPEAIRKASEHGDSIVTVAFGEQEALLYPVRIAIRGIDRPHLLSDMVACITEQQNLSISRLHTETRDRIVETTVDFGVHSIKELQKAIESIACIENVDEVLRADTE